MQHDQNISIEVGACMLLQAGQLTDEALCEVLTYCKGSLVKTDGGDQSTPKTVKGQVDDRWSTAESAAVGAINLCPLKNLLILLCCLVPRAVACHASFLKLTEAVRVVVVGIQGSCKGRVESILGAGCECPASAGACNKALSLT